MGRSDQRIRVQVLGPIRVLDAAGRDRTPDGALQRRLLAALILRRGHVVTADAAIDALWPATAPRDPVAALQNHMFRLRRALPEGLIESVGTGYRVDPARVDMDADHLLAHLAEAHPTAATIEALDELLARWTGPAYPELDDLDEGRAVAIQLEELRVRALEVRAEARLALGDTDGLVAELAALVAAEPLRERPRALMMSALSATGRNVEALRVYDDFRRLLGDELGVEPSPALAAQHASLLACTGPAAWVPPARLPVPATSLIGRDDLLEHALALVAERRLVTLVGPGGVGKTRLLLEIGQRLRFARRARPVVLCELAAIDPTDATAAVDVVAAALGIDARPGVAMIDRVVDVVGDAEIVVLLDNCEHVLDSAATIAERMLAGCANVRVVATSRERLRVPGEQVCAVPTLPLGDDAASAVQLFVERARAVAPGFEPRAAELACITEIVRRLDGLPLAIELAAARLHTHDVSEVAEGIDRRFALLSTGSRTSARHASLGAAVAWSFGLLDPALQRTFSELSVFAGSFTAADAAAVCALEPIATDAALAQLVERSLVMRAPGRRYLLLETLRAFGTEQLASAGRTAEVAERHARHLVRWTEAAATRMEVSGEPVLADVDAALPELRTALAWLLDHGDLEAAGRMVATIFDYAFMRLRPDVLGWAEPVLAADPDDRSPWAPRLWVMRAYHSWMAGDVDGAGTHLARALAVLERTGAEPHPKVTTMRGSQALFEGRLDEAAAWYRRAAVDAAEPVQRQMARANALMARGYAGDPSACADAGALLEELGAAETPFSAYIWYCAGETALTVDLGLARQRHTRSLELAERTHASFVIGLAGASKASIEARIGDPAEAADDFRRLLQHWRRAGMWSTQWTMLRAIAALLARLGRHREAAVLEGAVRSTDAGHEIFGADEVALAELSTALREALGAEAYDAAVRAGAVLDGDAAVEHALRSL